MESLKTIGWFTEPWDAHIACGRLHAEGIDSWVIHEHHVWANWMYSHALGQVKLQVLRQDVEQGRYILRRHWSGEYESELEAEFGPIEQHACPACTSNDVYYGASWPGTILPFALFAILGVTYPPQKAIGHCRCCGGRWRQS